MRRRALTAAIPLVLAAALPVHAQSDSRPSVPVPCDSAALRTPLRVDEDTLFLAIERATSRTRLPEPFAVLVLDELAGHVVAPSPLRLSVYADPDTGVRLTRDAKVARAAAIAEVRLTFRRRSDGGGGERTSRGGSPPAP
jgi:hypothetical protein